jgi:hypothetical protein
MTDRILVARYGVTVATDILVTHKRDAREFMAQKELYVGAIWQQRIREELHRLAGGGEHQPQEEVKEEPLPVPLREQIAARMQVHQHILAEESIRLIQKPDAERFPI